MVIYKITNLLNQKVYIGQTTQKLEVRMSEHLRKNNIPIDKAIKKYGIENFSVEVIDTAETRKELDEKEMKWVKFYNSQTPNGYNLTKGSRKTIGYHHTDEAKKKMSESKKGMYDGASNPFYGKTHTDAQKAVWSEKRKGLAHLTDEQVKRLRQSHYTKKVRCVETGEVFNSVKEAAEKYGLKDTHISRVCNGGRKTTGGFHWEYLE